MNVHSDNFADAWFKLLGLIYEGGAPVSPRGYETHELLGVQLSVEDMRSNILVHHARALSYRFLVAEWLWIAAGRNDVAGITRYNKNISQFSDDGQIFAGAYGPRIAPQMPWLFEQLKKPGSRQAVVSIWTPSPQPSKDIPCTLTWQLLARDGVLHGIVTMRSSDIHLGLPYDFFNFSQLTSGVAGALGFVVGSLVFNLGSSHLYDRDRERAKAVLDDPTRLYCVRSPLLPGLPPAETMLTDHLYDALDEPWLTYGRALRAPLNIDALQHLEALDK
jgi:thymidylate synthase